MLFPRRANGTKIEKASHKFNQPPHWIIAVTLHCCIPTGAPRVNLLRALVLDRMAGSRKVVHDSIPALLARLEQLAGQASSAIALVVADGESLAVLIRHRRKLAKLHLILVTSADQADLLPRLRPILPKAVLPLNADLMALVSYLAKSIEQEMVARQKLEPNEETHGTLGRRVGPAGG